MKAWFGVIGRSILEFSLVSALAVFIAGAQASLVASAPRLDRAVSYGLEFAARLFPAALASVLFFSFYSFERRVSSRAAGWLGIVLVGALLSGGGLAASRVPFLRDLPLLRGSAAETKVGAPLDLQEPGIAVARGGVLLWYRGAEAAAADFDKPFPRLSYSAVAGLDAAAAEIDIAGERYAAARPVPVVPLLLPELAWFSGSWVWDRQAGLGASPLPVAMAAAAAFVLLAAGFRFAARLTRWPLANACFGIAAFIGFLVLDASLWSPPVTRATAELASRVGLSGLHAAYPIAFFEALIGFLLGLLDLVLAPRKGAVRV